LPANLRQETSTRILLPPPKKEGFEQIAALFLKTADNEKGDAKIWFKELNGIADRRPT
jgi:hypothetical protein